MRTRLVITLLLCLPFSAFAQQKENPRAAIIEGVKTIAVPGVPGPLCVFADAFVVATADVDGVPAPIIAAASLGKGHLVALGHEGYFSKSTLATGDTELLIKQLIQYAGSGRPDPAAPIRVVYYRQPDIHDLGDAGIWPIKMERWDSELSLNDADILICAADKIPPGEVERLERFVTSGGGIICGIPGWGWLQTHEGMTLAADLVANTLFARAGVAWVDGFIDVPPNKQLTIDPEPSKYLNASIALAALREAEKPGATKLSAADTNLAMSQLLRCLDNLPRTTFDDELHALVRADVMALPVPSPARPVTNEMGLTRLRLAAHLRACQDAPVNRVRAERAAEVFPGEVSDTAQRVSTEVPIHTAIPGWHSTGLYAPPGEFIHVDVTKELLDSQIRIGARRSIENLPVWMPAGK